MKKAVLITGAGVRVGKYLALGLAAKGWAVAVHYNQSQKPAEDVVAQIKSNSGHAIAIGANLNVQDELGSLIEKSVQALGQPLTALINSASTFAPDRIDGFDRASFDHHMDVNLYAPLMLSQHFAAQTKSNMDAAIINIIDQRVLKPNPEFLTYSLSKSALHWATKTLAQALAPTIRVNGIGPGPTLKNVRQSDEDFANEAKHTLLGRGSPPEQILQACLYLLAANSVTGQMLAVDGGQHLTWQTEDLISGNI